jgi:hypothetical protein
MLVEKGTTIMYGSVRGVPGNLHSYHDPSHISDTRANEVKNEVPVTIKDLLPSQNVQF